MTKNPDRETARAISNYVDELLDRHNLSADNRREYGNRLFDLCYLGGSEQDAEALLLTMLDEVPPRHVGSATLVE
jgi:hypothetical protein